MPDRCSSLLALVYSQLADLGKEVMLAKMCSFLVSLDCLVLYPGDQKRKRFFSPFFPEGKMKS